MEGAFQPAFQVGPCLVYSSTFYFDRAVEALGVRCLAKIKCVCVCCLLQRMFSGLCLLLGEKMKLDASASETHTPAGTVTATPAQHLLRRPQAHTPYLSWLAGRRGGLSRDHAGETRKTAPRPLFVLFCFTLFRLPINRCPTPRCKPRLVRLEDAVAADAALPGGACGGR